MNKNPLKQTFNHIGYDVTVVAVRFQKLPNERIGISLVTQDGEPWCDATMNTPGLNHDEMAIKNYSENIGVLSALYDAGYIEKPHREVSTGYVQMGVTRLTPAAKEMAEKQFKADRELSDEGTPAGAAAAPRRNRP